MDCQPGELKTKGDGFLVDFSSVVDALRCATEAQANIAERNATVPPDKRIQFSIGINVGDVVVDHGDIFGDGVNVAARLEALAEPGGICVSARVQEDAAGRLDLPFEDMGEQSLKNIARPVRVCRVRDIGTAKSSSPPHSLVLPLPDKPSIAVLPFANMSGDPEQEYFVDGMVEEIITALSRIRWLFVVARNSTFTYKQNQHLCKGNGPLTRLSFFLRKFIAQSDSRPHRRGPGARQGSRAELGPTLQAHPSPAERSDSSPRPGRSSLRHRSHLQRPSEHDFKARGVTGHQAQNMRRVRLHRAAEP
jgi:hypothetical protein